MLTHIHPSRLRFTCRTRPIFNGAVNPGTASGAAQGPPDAQSSFARTKGLSRTARRLAPRQRALPLLHRSYELMRQTKFLPVASARLIPLSLCRLLSVPAARWPFPALAPQLFPQMPGPLPRRFSWCTYPLLPRRHRPSPRVDRLGNTRTSVLRLLYGNGFEAAVIR